MLFKPHPWHGIPPGDSVPDLLNAYIEIVPTDLVKYEIDKASAHLMVDRPQQYSNLCPALYGFIPQSYCGRRVGEYCSERTGHPGIKGDGDALDICVLSEHALSHGDILLKVIPIGGLRMIDGNQADDKILAVLRNDAIYGRYQDLGDCPRPLIERLRHYFLTYKNLPDAAEMHVEITDIYSRIEAETVIKASIEDYNAEFGDSESRIETLVSMIQAMKKPS
ncbi:MAG: inorganic pyrophosphatase [Candidatus Thermoplasmatota archaeon]|nr:inorganic pyrophosphatase [Candidatus Thermoplasmatota archaeon]